MAYVYETFLEDLMQVVRRAKTSQVDRPGRRVLHGKQIRSIAQAYKCKPGMNHS